MSRDTGRKMAGQLSTLMVAVLILAIISRVFGVGWILGIASVILIIGVITIFQED